MFLSSYSLLSWFSGVYSVNLAKDLPPRIRGDGHATTYAVYNIQRTVKKNCVFRKIRFRAGSGSRRWRSNSYSWLVTVKEFKDPVPAPSAGSSGKWVQRVPKSLHAKLAAKAEPESVRHRGHSWFTSGM